MFHYIATAMFVFMKCASYVCANPSHFEFIRINRTRWHSALE